MRHKHCLTWNIGRKLTTEENEKLTWQDMKYGEKHRKTCKKRNTHCRTQNMERKSENMKYEKYTLQDLDCGEKPGKRGK